MTATKTTLARTTPRAQSFKPKLQLPVEGFARLPVVLANFPVSKSSWWAGVKAGRFPKAVKLGPRMTAWRVEDIRALIAGADAASNDATVGGR